MSRGSYVVNDGGRLRMIGRGKPALPKGAVSRDEAARILMVDPGQVEAEVMHLRTALDTDCRTVGVGDDLVLHGRDVRDLANRKLRGEHRRRRGASSSPASAPQPRRERFEFSDPDDTPGMQQEVRVSASKVSKAAERFGLSEQGLTECLIGRAKMQVRDGELLIRNSDLSRLVGEGTLPDPAKRQAVDEAVAEIEGRKVADPVTESRVAAVADALGVDLGMASRAQSGSGSGGIVKVQADQESRRLGRPRRWSERTW
jgi:hypothetical protein